MARAKRKTVKRQIQRQQRKNSTSTSTPAESLDINSPSDVKKALDIMRKNPLTIILLFASWCPHCHTFMKRWNEYKSLPNRTSPMIRVEQKLSGQLLNEISNENGDPVNVSAFPSVLATTNANMNNTNNVPSVNGSTSTQRSNVGAPINHSDEKAMINILTNGSAALSQSTPKSTASSEPPSTETTNESMDASDFAESISNNDASFKKKPTKLKRNAATPFRRAELSNAIRKALQNTTAKRQRHSASTTALTTTAQRRRPTNEYFVAAPKPEELTMGGGGCTTGTCGGPSGLIKLASGGGMSQTNTLFELLKNYSQGNKTRKNIM